jgi:endonuclease/exonuclease/phosphatase (EEP) superfamily protein YafD
MTAAVVAVLTGIAAAMTLLPFIPLAHGLIRVCDFPRIQIATLALLLSVVSFALLPAGVFTWALIAVQLSTAAVQGTICARFTSVWRVQSLPHKGDPKSPSVVRILAANVKMSNRDYPALLQLAREHDPQILICMETDEAWLHALSPLKTRMTFSVEQPQSNAYGMALYSRLPLINPELRFLVLPEVPSIRCIVELEDGRRFRLHVLHPEPPVPYEDTLGRDGELIMVAGEVKKDALPCIVTGDLNDVAWSRTTLRFQRLSRLVDPRVGRGFYSTFDARLPLLRWPLDHLFHDARFRLAGIEVLPYIGSDHFPILFKLALADTGKVGEMPERPDGQDVAEASEVAAKAKNLLREPVGAAWEK